jgi:hypothetical protein
VKELHTDGSARPETDLFRLSEGREMERCGSSPRKPVDEVNPIRKDGALLPLFLPAAGRNKE